MEACFEEEEEIVINEPTKNLCKDICKKGYDQAKLSRFLFEQLMRQKIINDDDDYFSVKSNIPLMKVLLKNIALGLEESVSHSIYGCQIVSDFNMYFNLNSESKLDKYLEAMNFDKNDIRYGKLKKNRINIQRFVSRLRDNAVRGFDLPDTPQKEPVEPKTKQSVQKEVIVDLASLNSDGEIGISTSVTKKRKTNDQRVLGLTPVTELTFAEDHPLRGTGFDKDLASATWLLAGIFGEFKEGMSLVIKLDSINHVNQLQIAICEEVDFSILEGTCVVDIVDHNECGVERVDLGEVKVVGKKSSQGFGVLQSETEQDKLAALQEVDMDEDPDN